MHGRKGGADYTDKGWRPGRIHARTGIRIRRTEATSFIIAVGPGMCILTSRIQMAADIQSTLPIGEHRLMSRIGVGAYGEVWMAESVVGTRRAA